MIFSRAKVRESCTVPLRYGVFLVAIQQVPNIVRVTWKYGLQAGSTIEDTSQHSVTFLAGAIPSTQSVVDAVLLDMATAALASQVANVSTALYHQTVIAQECRVAVEGTNGHTLFEKFAIASGDLSWQGSNPSPSLPWECAVAVSLYGYQPGTFDTLGKSKRGRFYTPPPCSSVLQTNGSGELATDSLQTLVQGWAQVLKELQQHNYSGFPDFSPILCINSRRHVAAFPVTYIRGDTKIDSQRRRQRQEPATIEQGVWPTP